MGAEDRLDDKLPEILGVLATLEADRDVRILYACESGSRAWGFASPDSDYDVRFVYARPQECYLSFDVERRRDVIELPIADDIDCDGWDLRKALGLFARTNGALLEWLHSPIRYVERGGCAAALRALAAGGIDDAALCHHYLRMAKRNDRQYLHGERVRLKKYLYALRPLLAIRYIESGAGLPPVRFGALVDAVAPADVRPAVAELVERRPSWARRSRFRRSGPSSSPNWRGTPTVSENPDGRTARRGSGRETS